MLIRGGDVLKITLHYMEIFERECDRNLGEVLDTFRMATHHPKMGQLAGFGVNSHNNHTAQIWLLSSNTWVPKIEIGHNLAIHPCMHLRVLKWIHRALPFLSGAI